MKNIKRFANYRWIVWGVLTLSYMTVIFHRLAVGVIKDNLISDFSMTSTNLANLGSMYFYPYMFMQIPAGILADTVGARITVTSGVLLSALGSILFGLSPNIHTAFAGRLLVGLGVSVVYVAILKIQAEWFYEREFSTMSGLTSFVGNMGGVLAQSPLVILVSLLTWRYTFVMVGVVSVLAAIMIYVIVRNKPSDIGLPSISEGKDNKVEGEKVSILKALLDVCKNPYTWPSFLLFAGFNGTYVALTGTWGQGYLINVYGMSSVRAANYMTLVILGFAIGSIFTGRISDKMLSRKIPMITAGGMYILTWGLLVYLNGGKPPAEILGILFLLMGLSCSAFMPSWACVKEINNPKFAGISVSVVNMGGFFGAAIIPLFPGWVMDKYSASLTSVQLYQKAFFYCFISALIGYLLVFFVKETKCRNIYGFSDRKKHYS